MPYKGSLPSFSLFFFTELPETRHLATASSHGAPILSFFLAFFLSFFLGRPFVALRCASV